LLFTGIETDNDAEDKEYVFHYVLNVVLLNSDSCTFCPVRHAYFSIRALLQQISA
jgi:hypothetical protein